MEFIHTADWQIGFRFPGVEPALRKKLDGGIRQTLKLLFIYAKKKRVPLILCAGNAFANSQLADAKLLTQLFELLADYPDIQLVIAPGAEDALVAGNIYSRSDPSQFPANLHLATENKILPFPELQVSIMASPAMAKQVGADPLQWLEGEALTPDTITVGLCHYPHYKAGDAASLGLDYLACGGGNHYREIDPRCHYPGPPAQTGFDECGFPLHVKIEAPGATPRVKTIPGIAPFEWIEENLQLTDQTFEQKSAKLGTGAHRQIKKIDISGQLSIRNYINYQDLLESKRSGYLSMEDRVRIQPTDEDIQAFQDSRARDLARSLLELKAVDSSSSSEPGTILRMKAGTFFMDRKAVADTADAIPDDEIIGRALVELYRQFGPDA